MTDAQRLSLGSIPSEDTEHESSDEEQEGEFLDEDDTFDDDLWASRLTRRFTTVFPAAARRHLSSNIHSPRIRLSVSPSPSPATKLRHTLSAASMALTGPKPSSTPHSTQVPGSPLHNRLQNIPAVPTTSSPHPIRPTTSTKPPVSPRKLSSVALSTHSHAPDDAFSLSPRVNTSRAPNTPLSPRASNSSAPSTPLSPRANTSNAPNTPLSPHASTSSVPTTPGSSSAPSTPHSPRTIISIPPGLPLSPRTSMQPTIPPLCARTPILQAIPLSPNTIESIPPGLPLSPRVLNPTCITRTADSKSPRLSTPLSPRQPVLTKSPMHTSCDSIVVPPTVPRKLSAPAPVESTAMANVRLRSLSSPASTPPTPPPRTRQGAIAQQNIVASQQTVMSPPAPPAKPAHFTFAVPNSPAAPDEAQLTCPVLRKPLPRPPVPPKRATRSSTNKLDIEKAALRIQRCYRMWRAQCRYHKMVAVFRYRSHIATEIISTERSYVGTLRQIMSRYYEPIVSSSSSWGIDMEDIKVIFGGLEVLLNVNSRLLGSLEERMSAWSPVQCLGDLFLDMAAFLKTYTEYVKNFDLALLRLADSCKSQRFETFLRTTEECNGVRTPLEALLITPVQRIPRYVLLLQQLHDHTPQTHPDYDFLQKAIIQIKDVASYINEKKRESDSALRVVQIQSLLAGKAPNIITAQRRFCHEGELSILSRSGKKRKKRYWFLFNDILLCTNPLYMQTIFSNKRKFKYQLFIALHGADLLDQEDSDTGFVLATPTHLYSMYADTPELKTLWKEKIIAALTNLRISERFYEERVSKICQEKAKATKAFITSQYTSMRVQDAFHSFPAPDKKPANPATTGTYTVSKVPPSAPRVPRGKLEEEVQTADEREFTEFLTKGGQRTQFAELLKRLVGKASSSPEPVHNNSQRSSAPLKIQTTESKTSAALAMVRRNSNANASPPVATIPLSPQPPAAVQVYEGSQQQTQNTTLHKKKNSGDEEAARRRAKAKSIADVAALKAMMLHELSDKCQHKR